ncbi:signal transduction histidine kinase-like protein [Clostridium sp. CAG:798]|jgi:signal transduction histidine kinase|nr:signal transduction histidine kinase-like protein [Clostridium sp. CAG:798]
MIAILIILSLILVAQTIKIIVKTNIIDKNLIDYYIEYVVAIIILLTLIFEKIISLDILLLVTITSLLYEVISFIYMYFKYIKEEKINQFSIKKVIDSSDFGILVLKGNKSVLINNTMYAILNKLNIRTNYIANIIKQSEEQMEENYVVKVEEKYYLFIINQNEVIVFDITEEYCLKNELDEQNEKIKRNNKELVSSIENIEKLEKEKNLLKIKNKYHDLLGQNLSVLQQYLNREEIKQENFDEIKFMIEKMFIDIEDTEDPNTNLQNLIKIHQNNGTNIIIKGKLPKNEKQAKVFFEIIREATTNAIKHAESSKIFVEIKETLEKTNMVITNDGKKPNEFITENEGIKGMRRKVEEIKGYFYVSTVPEFSVNVSIKNNC